MGGGGGGGSRRRPQLLPVPPAGSRELGGIRADPAPFHFWMRFIADFFFSWGEKKKGKEQPQQPSSAAGAARRGSSAGARWPRARRRGGAKGTTMPSCF